MDSTLDLLVTDLTSKWESVGLARRPGASFEQIRQQEEFLGCAFHPDLRHFYQLVDGQAGPDDDRRVRPDQLTFWTLRETELTTTASGEQFIVFADYLIRTYTIAQSVSSGLVTGGTVEGLPLAQFLRDYIQRG